MYRIVYTIYGKPFAMQFRKITIYSRFQVADNFSKHFVPYTSYGLLASKPSPKKQARQAA